MVAVAPRQSPLNRILASDGIRIVTAAVVEDTALRQATEPFADTRYACSSTTPTGSPSSRPKKGFYDLSTLLEEISRPAQAGHHALLAADATPHPSGARRSLAKVTNEAVMAGTRILLTPAKRADARQLSMTLEPDQYFTRPPGRGYLATTGAPTLIQLATAYSKPCASFARGCPLTHE